MLCRHDWPAMGTKDYRLNNFEKSKDLICMYLIDLNAEIPTRIGLFYIPGKFAFLQNLKMSKDVLNWPETDC